MTALAPSTESTVGPPAPTGRFPSLRTLLMIAAPLPPLAMAIGTSITPYAADADLATILTAVAKHPGATSAQSWLGLLITVTLVPAVIVVGLAALSRAPRLATVGLAIAVPGWAAGMLLPEASGLAAAMVTAGTDQPTAVALLNQIVNVGGPAQSAAVLIFVAGHIVGTVLLGIALLRSRAVHPAAAALVIIAEPLHFVAFVVTRNTALDVVSALCAAVGFGAAGVAYWRAGR